MNRPIRNALLAFATAALLVVATTANAAIKGQLLMLQMDSHSLGRKTTVYVYLPPNYDHSTQRLPVVYLLHGNPGKSSDWFNKGHIDQTTDAMITSGKIRPMIVVAADCFGRGGSHSRDEFLNSADGSLMAEDFVAHELVAWIDGRYRTIRSANARALLGLSSGGYGAINVGGKHTDVFHILVSHSGFFDPADENDYVVHMLGPKGPLWDANNPLKQVKNWRDKKSLHVYLDAGDDDDLLPESRDLAAELERCKIDHTFSVAKGGHEWALWRKQYPISIAWVDHCFG